MPNEDTLRKILLQLGLPETRDRTATPRTDFSMSDVVICVMSPPDKYVPILLEGGRRCPGHMLLCLSPNWVSRSPHQDDPDLFSLFVHRAVTFEAGGYTYFDAFNPPCRVTYLLEANTDEQELSLVDGGLDCPTSGSPRLNSMTENVLLTRQLLGETGIEVPPMLALCYNPPLEYISQPPFLTIVSMEKPEHQIVMEPIDTFLQLPELNICDLVTVQLSSVGWGSQKNVSVQKREDKKGIHSAVQTLLLNIKEGDSILLTGCVPSIQPLADPKVLDKLVRVPFVARASLYLRICASVCRNVDDKPQVTQILCWVDKADLHPLAHQAGLQSLRETLKDWGFGEPVIFSLQQLVNEKASTLMQIIMNYQSKITCTQRGGAKAQTDFIGVEFTLAMLEGCIQLLFQGVRAHTKGIYTTPVSLLNSVNLDKTFGPILQIMCHHSHAFLMAGKTLLFIGAGRSNKHGIWDTTKKHNIKTIVVSCRPDNARVKLLDDAILYNYMDHEQDEEHADAIIKTLEERNLKVDSLTFLCSNTVLAATLNAKLGLPCSHVDAINIAKNKSLVHQHLAGVKEDFCLFPHPSSYASRCSHVADPKSLAQATKHVGFPAVMKLECSAGSLSVKLMEDAQSCQEYMTSLMSSPVHPDINIITTGFMSEPLLMEYLEGEKYVVDLVMYGGKMLAAFVSECGPCALPYFFNSSQIMPSNLSPERETQMATAAYKCCLNCGLQSGVYNVDIMLTKSGPKLIEINPRIGGNYLPAWIKTVYGFDLYMATFLIACDIKPALWTPEPRGYYVGISSPATQHLKAMSNMPAFDSILTSLNESGVVQPSVITENIDPKKNTSTLNLASFRISKAEAFQRVLASFKMLGLDSGDYPVEHFLNPLK